MEYVITVTEPQSIFNCVPLGWRVEGGQARSLTKALLSAAVPGCRDVGGHEEEVARVPSRDEAQAALLCSVRAVHFVLCQRAVRVGVAREVLPEVRPVRHGAVPFAGCELLWQHGVVVEGEQYLEACVGRRTVY